MGEMTTWDVGEPVGCAICNATAELGRHLCTACNLRWVRSPECREASEAAADGQPGHVAHVYGAFYHFIARERAARAVH